MTPNGQWKLMFSKCIVFMLIVKAFYQRNENEIAISFDDEHLLVYVHELSISNRNSFDFIDN